MTQLFSVDMKLVWLVLVAVVTVNVSNAKSIIDNVSEKAVNKSAISKMLNSSSPVTSTSRNSSIFPNIPDRSNKFVINLKPTIKTESQTTKPDSYSKRLMKKLSIKYVNNGNARLPAEITTRRALMKIRKFTVKPHDIYAESVREKHNWNSNRKINTNNFRKSKSERYVTEKNTKPSNEEDSSEQRFLNFKNVDTSINDNDSDEFEKEENKNNYVAAGSQKSRTVLLFPNRNYMKNIKVDPEQRTSERTRENNSVSENKISSDAVNHQNDKIIEDKDKSIITNKILIQSKPKENFADQEKADLSEFNFINGVMKNDVSFVPDIDDVEISTGRDLDFFVI